MRSRVRDLCGGARQVQCGFGGGHRQGDRALQPDVLRRARVAGKRGCDDSDAATSIPIAGESFHSRGAAQSERAGCLAAHLRLSAALSNFVILEKGNTDPVLNRELFGSWHDSRAYFLPPETPGLGIKLSDAFVREHPVDAGLS